MTDAGASTIGNTLRSRPGNPYLPLRRIADGCTNQEIADRMFLSVETIKTYRKNLMHKFGTKNAAELVQVAIGDKWV